MKQNSVRSHDSYFLCRPHFLVDTVRAAVRATDVCGSAMYEGLPMKYCFIVSSV